MSADARSMVALPSLPRAAAGPAPAGGAPAPGQILTLADVTALRLDLSTSARTGFAARFGRQYDAVAAGEARLIADAVLECLVRDVEKEVRRALAEAIAASPSLPFSVACALARDEIEVATPILERSPVLDDAELEVIVRTHSMQYALAVAGRERLSVRLAEAVAATGDREVVRRLVGNAGAELSGKTLMRIVHDYRDDQVIQDRLIQRPALPFELVDHMVSAIGQRLEWALVRSRRIRPDEARRLMAAVREHATMSLVAREGEDLDLERELRRRLLTSGFGPDDVLTFLRDGDIARLEAGLALLAELNLPTVRRLLYGADKRGLAALCIRARFGTPQYAVLRMSLELAEFGLGRRELEAIYSPNTLRFIHSQYESMRQDEETVAQWFLE